MARCCAARGSAQQLWRAVQLLGLLLGALLLRQYTHWGRGHEPPPPPLPPAVAAHFAEALAVLRPLVQAKRAALSAGDCPACEPSSRGAEHGRVAQRLSRLEQLERELLAKAGPGLELPPLPHPAPAPVAAMPTPAAAAARLAPAVPLAASLLPTAETTPSLPELVAPAAVAAPTVAQRGAETALSALTRLTPQTATPRTFIVYAPSPLPGQQGADVSAEGSGGELATSLARAAPDAVRLMSLDLAFAAAALCRSNL
jgi:hypothetical protein